MVPACYLSLRYVFHSVSLCCHSREPFRELGEPYCRGNLCFRFNLLCDVMVADRITLKMIHKQHKVNGKRETTHILNVCLV